MPDKDGKGPGSGRGMGQGRGQRSGSGNSPGPGGFCVCPSCGEKKAHRQGVPCYGQKCPKCGTAMIRE